MALLKFGAAVAVQVFAAFAAHMDCQDVPLCGVLTLESGLGDGMYHHAAPTVHGLWPQNGPHGTSQCIAPHDSSDATSIPVCYNNKEAASDPEHQLSFVNHEWKTHGRCAAARDVADFFGQVCSLASNPIGVLARQKEAGASFEAMVQAMRDVGLPVFSVDSAHNQIELSVCACKDGRWKLAKTSEFSAQCCGGAPSVPTPNPAGGQCQSGARGPACSSDADCDGFHGCVRCAHSRQCTAMPLSSLNAIVVV